MNPISFKNDQYTWGGRETWMEILQGVESSEVTNYLKTIKKWKIFLKIITISYSDNDPPKKKGKKRKNFLKEQNRNISRKTEAPSVYLQWLEETQG